MNKIDFMYEFIHVISYGRNVIGNTKWAFCGGGRAITVGTVLLWAWCYFESGFELL